MASYIPEHNGLPPYPVTYSGNVTAGNVITVAGAVAGANATNVLGVADRDGVNGTKAGYYPLTFGVQRVVASTAITAGSPIKTAASGKVQPFVDGTDAQDRRIGKALTTANADGDVILASKA
jgi:hypothetical protein